MRGRDCHRRHASFSTGCRRLVRSPAAVETDESDRPRRVIWLMSCFVISVTAVPSGFVVGDLVPPPEPSGRRPSAVRFAADRREQTSTMQPARRASREPCRAARVPRRPFCGPQFSEWKPPHEVLRRREAFNLTESRPDRHLANGNAAAAIVFRKGEPGDTKTLTAIPAPPRVCRRGAQIDPAEGRRPRRHLHGHGARRPPSRCSRARASAPALRHLRRVQLGRAVRDRINDCPGPGARHQDGAWRRGGCPFPEADGRRRRSTRAGDRSSVDRGREPAPEMREGRDHWWDDLAKPPEALAEEARPDALTPSTRSSSLHRRARRGSRGRLHTTAGYSRGARHHQVRLRPEKAILLVHGRRRLGHRPQLRRVYGPLSAGVGGDVRGRPNFPDAGRFWKHHREARGSRSSTPRPRPSAPSSRGRRVADEIFTILSLRLPGSVGEPINPEAWTGTTRRSSARSLPDRRHVVADGDRLHHARPSRRRYRKPGSTGPMFGVDRHRRDRSRRQVPRRTRAESSSSGDRGPRWRAPLGATTSATQDLLGRHAERLRSPATAPGATRTAISGSSAASTTSSTSRSPHRHRGDRSALVTPPSQEAPSGKPDDLEGQALVVFVTLKSGRDPEGPQGEARRAHRQEIRKFARGLDPPSWTRSRRRAPERSCAVSSKDRASGAVQTQGDTRRRSRTSASSRSSRRTKIDESLAHPRRAPPPRLQRDEPKSTRAGRTRRGVSATAAWRPVVRPKSRPEPSTALPEGRRRRLCARLHRRQGATRRQLQKDGRTWHALDLDADHRPRTRNRSSKVFRPKVAGFQP